MAVFLFFRIVQLVLLLGCDFFICLWKDTQIIPEQIFEKQS